LISARICTRSFTSEFDSGSFANNRPSHRDALPRAARELTRIATEAWFEPEVNAAALNTR
jgi:hypothetical protein